MKPQVPGSASSATAALDDDDVINLDERQAARFLGIGARTLWQLRKNGSVPYVRFGKSVRYPKPLLVRWLMEQATTTQGDDTNAADAVQASTRLTRTEISDPRNPSQDECAQKGGRCGESHYE
jgi:excisionase family DNA binding protein